MYQPAHFKEERLEVLHDLMQAHPLATLVNYGPNGITANHVPLLVHSDVSENGTLRGHIARANPLWKELDASVEVIAIFQGPHHYVTPSWYATKKEHGKVVPTWNYAVVHAHGPLKIIDDGDWLLQQVNSMTTQHETGRDLPWSVNDAPDDYIESRLKGIVGLELPIRRIEGKWKASQNQPDNNRQGVIDGLRNEDTNISNAMADLTPR